MKATLSFTFDFDHDNDCDLLQHLAQQIKAFPARRRDDAAATTDKTGRGDLPEMSGDTEPARHPDSGDAAVVNQPERREDSGDEDSGDFNEAVSQPAIAARVQRIRTERGRSRKAASPEQPPAPLVAAPSEGKPDEDVSGPDEENTNEHLFKLDTIGQDGYGRSAVNGDKYLISVTEARELAVKHLQAVFWSGAPNAKKDVAAYMRELNVKAFSDIDDDRAYDMYRRSVEMMHAVGKSA